MAEQTENKSAAAALKVNYAQMAASQAKQVEDLEKRVKESPSPALTEELDRSIDKLRFYQTAAKGQPRTRAAKAAAAAKRAAIGKAIVQPAFD
ncbi:MAG: hypothetical protein ACRD6X_04080 [Pyrinomonadaceae bacterium]